MRASDGHSGRSVKDWQCGAKVRVYGIVVRVRHAWANPSFCLADLIILNHRRNRYDDKGWKDLARTTCHAINALVS
jgi:hypothetical protein